jgi:hypothetical protein
LKFLVHKEEEKMLKKFVKMLWLIKKSAYVIYECPQKGSSNDWPDDAELGLDHDTQ